METIINWILNSRYSDTILSLTIGICYTAVFFLIFLIYIER